MNYDFSSDMDELQETIRELYHLHDKLKLDYKKITAEEAKSIIDSGESIYSLCRTEQDCYRLFKYNKKIELEGYYVLFKTYSTWYQEEDIIFKNNFEATEWYKKRDDD